MSISTIKPLKAIPAFAVTNYRGGVGYLTVAIKAIRHTATDETTMGISYYHSVFMPHSDILKDYWVCIYRCADGVMLAYSNDFFSKLQSVIRPFGGIDNGL